MHGEQVKVLLQGFTVFVTNHVKKKLLCIV